MKAKLSIITLGVQNLADSTAFYEKLGFPKSEFSNEGVSFFEMQGTWLGLYPKDKLAEDAQVDAKGNGFSGFSIAHNVGSPAEVDATLQHVVSCGATLRKAGQEVFWGGYSGYFADPDGYLWEVAYNPFMNLT